MARYLACRAAGPSDDGTESQSKQDQPGQIKQTGGVSSKQVQVSSEGRVRSTKGVVSYGSRNTRGYCAVKINRKSYYVHRLVCQTFYGLPPSPVHAFVNHKDGNRSNNTLENLEWCTPAENQQHAHALPDRKSSADAQSKPVRGRKIGSVEWREFDSCNAAARELGISRGNIHRAASGKRNTGGWEFEFMKQHAEIEGEIWRPVVLNGAETGAHVSDKGRVRRKSGIVPWDAWPNDSVDEERCEMEQRYRAVNIKGRIYFFHRLVCEAFHGRPPTDHVCNHKDGDKRNNTPGNLEWCTQAENQQHARTLSGRKSNAGARSKPLRGRILGTEGWKEFESGSAAARELGLDPRNISGVARGERKHTGEWEFAFMPQYEEIEGEVWKDVVLPPRLW